MAESIHKNLECPVCLHYFTKPIKQCIVGHSFCSKCIDPNNIKTCPVCRKAMTDTRSIVLEQLLDSLFLTCPNKERGCPYLLPKEKMINHITECKYRLFICEGKIFCNWNCSWKGYDILEHFTISHKNNKTEFNETATIRYNDTTELKDIKLITAHYQLFWFKHKVDVNKRNVYWAIQFIGPNVNAQYYYYEFEIFNNDDDTKRFKITDYCKNDVEDINNIFETEQCVVISFKMLKNYVNNDGMYSYRFRLMKKKKPEDPKSPSTVNTKNTIDNALKISTEKNVNGKSTGAIIKSTGAREKSTVIRKASGKKKIENENHNVTRPADTDTIIWLPYIKGQSTFVNKEYRKKK